MVTSSMTAWSAASEITPTVAPSKAPSSAKASTSRDATLSAPAMLENQGAVARSSRSWVMSPPMAGVSWSST